MIKELIHRITGNIYAQKFLNLQHRYILYLMGIGSGAEVSKSGEKAIFTLLKRPPYCIFDIGANQGQFLDLAFSELGDSEFIIHSFEPSKYTFDLLVQNVPSTNKVRLNNFALGKENGTFPLFTNESGSGLASLSKRKLDHFGISFDRSEIVTVVMLDNYCTEHAVDHIHLLKIDVEGHELDVLQGAQAMLNRQAVDIVSFEFGGCNIDSRTYFQDIFYVFNDLKMSIFRITPSGFLYPIKAYREQYEQFITTNFVAINANLFTT